MSATEPERPVKRKCRWCGRTFRCSRDYPKGRGCPDCAPSFEGAGFPEREAKDEAKP